MQNYCFIREATPLYHTAGSRKACWYALQFNEAANKNLLSQQTSESNQIPKTEQRLKELT